MYEKVDLIPMRLHSIWDSTGQRMPDTHCDAHALKFHEKTGYFHNLPCKCDIHFCATPIPTSMVVIVIGG